jgi:hypothetical protein
MNVIASDFASIKDLAAYKAAKKKGMSDKEAFKIGDNGVGCWGALTAQEETKQCALPPDDMIEKFGSIAKAKHALVKVTVGDKTIVCILADRMPWKKNIKNGCGIDLNPAALKALGLKSPIKLPAVWRWA